MKYNKQCNEVAGHL